MTFFYYLFGITRETRQTPAAAAVPLVFFFALTLLPLLLLFESFLVYLMHRGFWCFLCGGCVDHVFVYSPPG